MQLDWNWNLGPSKYHSAALPIKLLVKILNRGNTSNSPKNTIYYENF
jgi:hypothetical protein